MGLIAWKKVAVWGAVNNWEAPYKEFHEVFESTDSIQLIYGNILLRGTMKGNLEFIDYTQTRHLFYSPIKLCSYRIEDILTITKNIVIILARDENLYVIDPISRICYFKFKLGDMVELLNFLFILYLY